GNDHGEQAQVVEHLGNGAVDPGNVPGGHGAEQKNQGNRGDGDKEAVKSCPEEGVVAESHALDVVGPANEGFRRGQCEGLQVDEAVCLEGVDDHLKNGNQPSNGQQGKQNGHDLTQTRILGRFIHYCCTSLRRVEACWDIARTATTMKTLPALAWATPCQLLLML